MYPVIVPNDFMYSISCFSWIHFFFFLLTILLGIIEIHYWHFVVFIIIILVFLGVGVGGENKNILLIEIIDFVYISFDTFI